MLQEDVLSVVSPYLTRIKRSGADHIVAACPFHRKADGSEESNPSFTVSLTKGLYLCFTCNAKGNLQTFLREVGMPRSHIERHYQSIIDALAVFSTPKIDLGRAPPVNHAALQESVLGLFDYCPISLLEEGFEEQLLHAYDVGFDKDHMRITYPLRDMQGKLIGISGRTVTDEYPKYKLYDKEYQAWGLPFHRTDKRVVLWNYHRVYSSAVFQHKTPIILVEGFKACLWLIQHGYVDTVALLGVRMSDEQHMMLERLGNPVYVMLDNNEWGRLGTARVAAKLAKSLTVKIVEYPEDKPQPSDLSPEEIPLVIAGAKDYYQWAMEERNRQCLLERTPQILEQ